MGWRFKTGDRKERHQGDEGILIHHVRMKEHEGLGTCSLMKDVWWGALLELGGVKETSTTSGGDVSPRVFPRDAWNMPPSESGLGYWSIWR